MTTVLERQLDVYEEQPGTWAGIHSEVALGYEAGQAAAFGNDLVRRIGDFDTAVETDFAAGRLAAAEFERLKAMVERLYRRWEAASAHCLGMLSAVEGRGVAIDGAAALRQNLREVRGLLTPDAAFFAGPELAKLQDQALAEHRAGLTAEMMEMGD